MRLTVSSLRCVFNRDLRIEFGSEKLTSYAGLEMIGRFLRRSEFARRVRAAFASEPLGGDYGTRRLVLLVIGLLLTGGRRLKHLQYVANDPLFGRRALWNFISERGRRRKPSPSSRTTSPSMSSRPIITAPTVPGSNSRSSRITDARPSIRHRQYRVRRDRNAPLLVGK
jgi:hypothetical protein